MEVANKHDNGVELSGEWEKASHDETDQQFNRIAKLFSEVLKFSSHFKL